MQMFGHCLNLLIAQPMLILNLRTYPINTTLPTNTANASCILKIYPPSYSGYGIPNGRILYFLCLCIVIYARYAENNAARACLHFDGPSLLRIYPTLDGYVSTGLRACNCQYRFVSRNPQKQKPSLGFLYNGYWIFGVVQILQLGVVLVSNRPHLAKLGYPCCFILHHVSKRMGSTAVLPG